MGQSFKKWKESNKRSSLFPFYLNSILQKYGEHYGDGVHIVFIMYQSIKSTISKFNGRRRFEAIEILDNILSTLHTYEHLFTKYMVSCDIWHSYPNVRYWCHDMFHCILLPAANSGVASKLTTFLMKWIFPVSSEIITAVSVLETCKRYRSDLSLFLFNSSTAAADAHKSHSSIDVLDQHEVLISGRCLDLSSINLKDQQHSIRHFICIHSLYASSIDDTVTLNLSSAGQLGNLIKTLDHLTPSVP